ncbi:MAG: phosphoglycerate dehydrogenase [Thermodesulfobacteriota bacterium]|nr:phosphoglycerate dehydrogenase [Thermodesulfobacteriota bacterium]
MKVLVSDSISEKGIKILKKIPEMKVVVHTKHTPEELGKLVEDCDALIVRSATKVTKDIIEKAKKLKVVGRAGSGLDNIDATAATKKGIVVMNTPGGNTITTAEHAISLLFALARKTPQANTSMKNGKWEKGKFVGTELNNKTLGVIGVGRIGSAVAERAKGLKMHVIAFDPFVTSEMASMMDVELVSFEKLLAESHFITLHTPLTNETRGLLNKAAFAKMQTGVMIINCARGGIIDEDDLLEAIKAKKVAGVALDVFEKEPPAAKPLYEMDEVILTPHLGASTEEAQENVAIAIVEQIVNYLTKGEIQNATNVPSVSKEVLEKLQPYLSIAEKIGSFQAQIDVGGLKEITIEYSGEVTRFDLTPITISFLKGLLSPTLTENINFVNAPVVAKERGIKVVETKISTSENFTNLLTLKTKTSKGEQIISGTLFNNQEQRIVRINQFRVEVIPEGEMLIVHTHDRPGVIGSIGTILGHHNINIARMQFSREKQEDKALVVLNNDSPISEEVMKTLSSLQNILSVKKVVL